MKTYLPRSIDGYEHLLEGMVWYMAQLHEAKKKGQVKILMNPGFVLEFIKTGIIKEYPSIYFRTPLAPEDRRYILEQIFQAVEEGWYLPLLFGGKGISFGLPLGKRSLSHMKPVYAVLRG